MNELEQLLHDKHLRSDIIPDEEFVVLRMEIGDGIPDKPFYVVFSSYF